VRHCSNFLVWTIASISTFGCHHRRLVPEAQRDEDIRSVARSALVGLNLDILRVDVTVLNTAKTPRGLVTSPCYGNPLVVKVQRDGRVWESSAWESEGMKQPVRRDSAGNVIPLVFMCSAMIWRELPPGRSVLAYSSSTPVREVLGDSLPPGRYQISASFSLNQRSITRIPAGEVELGVPPT
jgi:hypothetical protein